MLKHILLVGLLSFSALPLLKAQSCGNDEKYHLPYKNTYVKEPLVTENEYRVAKPETILIFGDQWFLYICILVRQMILLIIATALSFQ